MNMKIVSIGPERLGGCEMTLEEALDMVSNDEIMRCVYGPSLIIKEWKDDTRILEFDIEICHIPTELMGMSVHSHVSPEGLTPQLLGEVFRHDVAAIFGDVHVDAHAASACKDPGHRH